MIMPREAWTIHIEAGPDGAAAVTRICGRPPPGTIFVLTGYDGDDMSTLALSRQLPGIAARQLAALAETAKALSPGLVPGG